jgi:hypothetical protein
MAVQYNAGTIATDGLVILIDPGSEQSYNGSGVTMTNRTGNGLNGTLTNSPTYTYANAGSYITTDGSNDRIQFPDSSQYQFLGTSPFTIDLWIYPLAVGGYQRILNRESNPGSLRDGYTAWFLVSTGVYYIGFERFGANVNGGISTTISNPIGLWSNYSFVYNGTTLIIYLNGLQIAAATSSPSITNTTELLTFGGAITYGSYSNNRFGQIKVYNRGLSATEVYNNYTAIRGRY